MNRMQSTSRQNLLAFVAGAMLILAGVAVVVGTTRESISYRAALSKHGGDILDLGAMTGPQSGQLGFMARVVGTPKVMESPTDSDFNLHVDAPELVRTVEMFQWREVRAGGVFYELDWAAEPIDAIHFQQPRGHANPRGFPISGKTFEAGLVQLDGFKLSPALLRDLPRAEPVAPQMNVLPLNLAASFSRHENYLTTSADPENPRLGDVRISWSKVPLERVTVYARIDGDVLVPADRAVDGRGFSVEAGDVPLLDLLPDMPAPPRFVFSRQILALLLASLGAFFVVPRRNLRRDPLLALGMGVLCVGAVATVLWLGNGALAMLIWLAVTLAGLGLLIWRLGFHTGQPEQPD